MGVKEPFPGHVSLHIMQTSMASGKFQVQVIERFSSCGWAEAQHILLDVAFDKMATSLGT
jgi:hypothetical protein